MPVRFRHPPLRCVPVAHKPQAANDTLLVDANEPSLAALLRDRRLLKGLIEDGLSPDHVKILTLCAARSERIVQSLNVSSSV